MISIKRNAFYQIIRHSFSLQLCVFFLFGIFLFALFGGGCSSSSEPETTKKAPDFSAMWSNTFHGYLQDPLWLQRDIYDSCHTLMVPLHAAFHWIESPWQDDFHAHFQYFFENREELDSGRLNRLHYLLLAVRYLVLCQETGHAEQMPEGFYSYLRDTFIDLWEAPARLWAFPPFDSMEDRLAAGLVEAIVTDLAKLSGLSVMAHASLLNLDSRSPDLATLRQNFGATHALRGSLEHEGCRARS